MQKATAVVEVTRWLMPSGYQRSERQDEVGRCSLAVHEVTAECSERQDEVGRCSLHAFGLAQRILLALVLIVLTVGISFDAETALDSNALGLWLCDEGAGNTVKDSSQNGNDGEITNAEWVDGKFEAALRFEGDGYVEVPSSESLESPTDEITIMAWINPQDINNKGIVYKGPFAGGSGDWDIHLAAGGPFQFRLNSGDWQKNASTPETGKWTHVAATYDKKTAILYLNGELDVEAQYNQPIASSGASLYLGSYWSSTYGFVGAIDEVYILKRALTQDEIKEAMNGLIGQLSIQPLSKIPICWGQVREKFK